MPPAPPSRKQREKTSSFPASICDALDRADLGVVGLLESDDVLVLGGKHRR